MDVGAWLHELGLGQYERAFRDNDVDAGLLSTLTADDLRELGIVSLGHRKRLLAAIAAVTLPSVPIPAPTAPQAERRQLTVTFVDLVGSTALSSKLDPEEMRELLRAYQNAVAGEVIRFEGHVAKFMGDGVLAYFGYPRAHEDEAERAVRAGLAIVDAVGRLAAPGGLPLASRVGIATGVVVVGDLIGEGSSREEAVAGETPNLAARLQGWAEPGQVVVSEATQRLLAGLFEIEVLGPQTFKGIDAAVPVFHVVRERSGLGRFEARQAAALAPLVGREQELALLLDRWERAKAGEGQLVLLAGEPGIGKSRLVQALHEQLAADRHAHLLYQCSPHHANSALWPVIQQLGSAAGFAHGDDDAARLTKLDALLRLAVPGVFEAVPLLAALLSIPPDDRNPLVAMDAQRQKQRTLRALVDQLAGLAARQPVLLVVEDGHWIDPTTVELLDLVADRLQELPVLLAITFRPEFAPPWVKRPHATLLSLSRLGRREGAAMVGRVAAGKVLPAEVLDQILAKTDGVPLFLEELTKTVLESGLLREMAGGHAVAGPLLALAIPSTLRDSLMARLDRLAPVKEVAQMAAVIGREFAHELLAAVSPLGDNALRDALVQLVQSELVFRRGEPPDAVYTFKHALVQDTAYQSLLKSRRRQLHATIAEVLEERFPDRAAAEPELLAHHFTEAGLVKRALRYWQRAGERAGARSANVEAVSHLGRGLALLDALPEGLERSRQELALQVALGVALMATRGSGASEAAAASARARELCELLGEEERLLPALYGEWGTRYIPAEEDKARALAVRFAGLAQRDGGARLVAERMLALHCFARGELEQARTHLERILAGYDPERHQALVLRFGYDARAAALSYLSWVHWHLGYPEQGLRASEEAAAWADQIAHANSKGMTLSFGVLMPRQFLRDAATVEDRARSLVELCDETRLPLWRGYGQVLGGWAAAAQGRTEDGLATLTGGIRELREINALRHLPYLLGLLAEVQAGAGRFADGLATVTEALEEVRRSGDHGWEGDLHRIRGDLLRMAGGQEVAAEAALEEAIDVARRHRAKSLELRAATSLARLRAERGQRREAHDALAAVHGWFTEGFDTPDLQEAKALLDGLRQYRRDRSENMGECLADETGAAFRGGDG